MPDDIDLLQEQELAFQTAALNWQRAHRPERVVALEIEGVKCCADCLDALEPHRIEYGLCLSCAQAREAESAGR